MNNKQLLLALQDYIWDEKLKSYEESKIAKTKERKKELEGEIAAYNTILRKIEDFKNGN